MIQSIIGIQNHKKQIISGTGEDQVDLRLDLTAAKEGLWIAEIF